MMTRRDWIAVATFVLGVAGGLYWRASRAPEVWCEAPDGTRMRLGDRILDRGQWLVCAETDTWTVVEGPKR